MQKKLIVLAIAAMASTSAFADSTVYGLLDVAVANVSASGLKGDTAVVSGGLAGSRLGVKSSEDLGGGLKSSIVLEYAIDPTASDALVSARQEVLALSGDFGTVAGGYLQTTGYDFSRFDPTAGSQVSPLGNIDVAGKFLIGNQATLKRAAKALAYISPTFSGVNVAFNYAADTSGGLGNAAKLSTEAYVKPTAYLASVNYADGPLAAGIVYASYDAGTTSATVFKAATNTAFGTDLALSKVSAKVTEIALGGSYDLGVAKLFAVYKTNKNDGNNDSNTAISLSAVAPVGPGSVVLSYAKASMKQYALTAAASAAEGMDGSGYTLAWLQGLSKTTTLYAAYSAMSQGDKAKAFTVVSSTLPGLANGTSSSMIALGLQKKF
jgi:predicted porin